MAATIGAGWYPDPISEYRERWWTGTSWTEHVRTGRFATVAPLQATPIPDAESEIWTDGHHSLSTHCAYPNEGRGRAQVPWWSVTEVDVRVPAGRALAGQGDIVLIIDYPGYTDRRERRMNRVADPDAVAALCFTWSRRHRKAAGYL